MERLVSFRYDVLNLFVIDKLRELFTKPSTEWTEAEYRSVLLNMEAMRIVAAQYKKQEPRHD